MSAETYGTPVEQESNSERNEWTMDDLMLGYGVPQDEIDETDQRDLADQIYETLEERADEWDDFENPYDSAVQVSQHLGKMRGEDPGDPSGVDLESGTEPSELEVEYAGETYSVVEDEQGRYRVVHRVEDADVWRGDEEVWEEEFPRS
jgi:hypothetical protein